MTSTFDRHTRALHVLRTRKHDIKPGADITEGMSASALDYVIGEDHAALGEPLENITKKPKIHQEKSSGHKSGECDIQFLKLARQRAQFVMKDGNVRDRKANVEGNVSLREWITRPGRVVDRVESLHIFRQVLEFVDLAHSQGVLLRNIRPSCFLLSSSHRVTFIDSASSRSVSSSERSSDRSTSPVKKPREVVEEVFGNASASGARELNNSGERGFGVGASSPQASSASPGRNRAERVKEDFSDVHGFPASTNSGDRNVSRTLNKYAWLKDWAGNLGSAAAEQCSSEAAHAAIQVTAIGAEAGDLKNSRNDSPIDISEDSSRSAENSFPLRQVLLIEQTLYTSPEELGGATSSVASDIYGLGVLCFELFCTFSSGSEWSRVMSNLRHRILPPRLLSEHPKEAALCLWLLHPESTSRPKAREVLQCELLNEVEAALAERQVAVDIEDKELEQELLLDFLLKLQYRKQEASQKLCKDIACLTADIQEIENRQLLSKQKRLPRQSSTHGELPDFPAIERDNFDGVDQARVQRDVQLKSSRLMNNFKQLEQAYFSMRWKVEPPLLERGKGQCMQMKGTDARSTGVSASDIFHKDQKSLAIHELGHETEDRLGSFFNNLCKFARYSQFKVKASLRHGDLLHTANMVCSLSFDRDEEYFATAGVCKRIKIFEYDAVLKEDVDIHYPIVEMASGSKLSSICWNSYIKNHIASSDYDGVVQLWDARTTQTLMVYKEHEKRAWSVDFSHADPTKLASGSDDGCVKLWSIKHEACICTLRMKANICCVQFSPHSAHLLACGCADYKIYCYDLRHTRLPLCVLGNHNKTVSYVKFLDSVTLVSASTDNTLKLWDISKSSKVGGAHNCCSLTYAGHSNEKNFVGLSVADGYIACGSETNEVFVYHRSFPMPMASHEFGSVDPVLGQKTEDQSGQFVSSVCWRGKSQTLVAANSMGNIKLLEMV